MLSVMDTDPGAKDMEPEGRKPLPARPPTEPAPPPAPSGEAPLSSEPQVTIVGRGGTWRVRVLGKSGRAGGRSVPLMLLEFSADGGRAPVLEAVVSGSSLDTLPDETLLTALARAAEPRDADRKRPFFEEADGARRNEPRLPD
jgi:hypothetical protein